jgi:hypothetical protein
MSTKRSQPTRPLGGSGPSRGHALCRPGAAIAQKGAVERSPSPEDGTPCRHGGGTPYGTPENKEGPGPGSSATTSSGTSSGPGPPGCEARSSGRAISSASRGIVADSESKAARPRPPAPRRRYRHRGHRPGDGVASSAPRSSGRRPNRAVRRTHRRRVRRTGLLADRCSRAAPGALCRRLRALRHRSARRAARRGRHGVDASTPTLAARAGVDPAVVADRRNGVRRLAPRRGRRQWRTGVRQYRRDAVGVGYKAFALQVVTLSDDGIRALEMFVDPDLLEMFGLPQRTESAIAV